MKIAGVGMSWVELPDAPQVAQHKEDVALDLNPKGLSKIGRRVSAMKDEGIECLLRSGRQNLSATLDHTDLATLKRNADIIL